MLIMDIYSLGLVIGDDTNGTFGTLNVDYIRNNNFYYWK